MSSPLMHDPLCDFMRYRNGKTQGCTCELITKARIDERARAEVEFSQRIAAGMRVVMDWRRAARGEA